MNNIAVLASTNGTDMQAIIDAIEQGKLDAEINVVISNKECPALEKARRHNIRAVFLDPKGMSREEYDKEVSSMIESHDVRLVLLIGYMRILSGWFVDKYRNKVMNVHPSLLPAYAGGMDLNVHRAVLERGCKLTGATLMFIDEGADTGPIISQKAVEVTDSDDEESLKEKVQKAEAELLLKAIPLYFQGRLHVEGNRVIVR